MPLNEALSQLTLDELYGRKQKLKGAIIGLSLVMGAALLIVGYLVLKNKTYGLLGIVFTMPITLIPSVMALNKISAEIKSRRESV